MLRLLIRSCLLLALILTTRPASAQGNSVDITLDQFGVGSAFRPGGLIGIRLELTGQLDEPTPVWVHWDKPNADGDIGEYGRSLTLTPGQPVKCWLYAPLSPDDNAGDVWSIKVFVEQNGIRGREIGGARITPNVASVQSFEINTNLIGIVGGARMGLDDYMSISARGRSVSANEETRIVSAIRTQDLPDRWYGLQPFEAIVWGTDQSPSVTFEQSEAIHEYVRRGGHLIIVLPPVGNPWGIGTPGQESFDDLMPIQVPRQLESVMLSSVLPVLGKSATAVTDFELDALKVFGEIGKGYDPLANNYYEPLIATPDGQIITVRRTFGFGHVTICGIDVTNRRLLSVDLPQADVFWNRILGRRMDTPSSSELKAIEDEQHLGRSGSNDNGLGKGNLFVQLIQHEQSASVGVLMAFILFILYWLVAGPGGFYSLKHYRQVRHAWLAFAATAGIFTALAWTAVAAVRPRQVVVKHVTVLDHIARVEGAGSQNPDRRDNDQQIQRAISYSSVFLPNYRNTPLSIESSFGRDVLYSWEPPGVAVSKFPNVDRYKVDVGRNLASIQMPSRSTTTRLYLNWLGGVDSDWGGMLRMDPANPIEVLIDPGGTERSIRGDIINELPGSLKYVTIFWVKNQRTRTRRYFTSGDEEKPWISPIASGQMLNTGSMWRISGTILPGDRLSVQPPAGAINLNESINKTYHDRYRSSGFTGMNTTSSRSISEEDRRNYLEMLSIFQQLKPPTYLITPGTQSDQQSSTFFREIGRELDLSVWFTRPCLIIIGWLPDSELPIPLNAEGQTIPSVGLTMVRWIYPLPFREDIAFKNVVDE